MEGRYGKTATPLPNSLETRALYLNLSELPLFQCWPGNLFFVKTSSILSGTWSASNSAGTL